MTSSDYCTVLEIHACLFSVFAQFRTTRSLFFFDIGSSAYAVRVRVQLSTAAEFCPGLVLSLLSLPSNLT